MIFQDIVALAKAGWTPKQIKEVLEAIETSPKVKEATKEEVLDKKEEKQQEPEVKKSEADTKTETDDPIAELVKILKEE